MNLPQVEKKWQAKWADTELYKFDENSDKPKYYVLEMFSYPSGANLHVGHWYNYSLSDSYARFMRMRGFNVFHPMGFDAFGLPAENYAIKTGIHPKDSTLANIATMETQLRNMGASFDWQWEVKTCTPDYYKWTQWCFLKLFEAGLAYRKAAPVNWCPRCNTVLANEQVKDGACERCETLVQRKHLTQWFFKITDYAERLLAGTYNLDWPEKTLLMQRNWIGKSTGALISFNIVGGGGFDVFTTRADTLYGCTYVVLAPEHELVDSITTQEYKKAVADYKIYAAKASEIDRLSTTREKTGAFTGAYCINPINGEKIPIWISDYVLASYGTGAVMAVPGHDERDFEHATKYGLPILRVVAAKHDEQDDALPFCDYEGVLVNSKEFDGLTVVEGKAAVVEKLKQTSDGDFKINYRLRDWLISRQRYWGAPIPIIHCEKCGTVPVPEDQLPVELPYNVDFTPDGASPLAKCEEFLNVACPACGAPAKREVDTMDTFMCSSWYFLRYPDNKNELSAWNPEKINKLLPVDKYIGGAEHACMHLLYARFFTMAFHDMGYVNFEEPFTSLVHQGTILGTDGEKMSKSRGNVISPDAFISEFGSDVFRMYLGFGFSYIEGGPWSESGIISIAKYLQRVERLSEKVLNAKSSNSDNNADLVYAQNYAIKAVSADISTFGFNTAIARIMELTNVLYKYTEGEFNVALAQSVMLDLLKLLSPFAPHFCEELWEKMGQGYSIFDENWATVDESALERETITMPLQVNGKLRETFEACVHSTKEDIEKYVRENFTKHFDGKEIVKIIIVPGKIVNVVVR